CVVTFMPAATGVVQEAGYPFIPSICTRHNRQEPNASSISVAQSFGIWIPASDAARSTDVPAGTLTSRPSTLSVTRLAILIGWIGLGVPRSVSLIDNMTTTPQCTSLLPSGEGAPKGPM